MTEPSPLTEELAGGFARMSGLLLSEETVATALGLVTSLAVDDHWLPDPRPSRP
jgi:hypothetical protein